MALSAGALLCPLRGMVVDVLKHRRSVVGPVDSLSNSYALPPLACWQKLPPTVGIENPRFSFFYPPLHGTEPWWMQPERMSAFVAKKSFLCNKQRCNSLQVDFGTMPIPTVPQGANLRTESMLCGWQGTRSLAPMAVWHDWTNRGRSYFLFSHNA